MNISYQFNRVEILELKLHSTTLRSSYKYLRFKLKLYSLKQIPITKYKASNFWIYAKTSELLHTKLYLKNVSVA